MSFWTRWHSKKHNDGRRASGVGWNRSKWHWIKAPEGLYVGCGREVQVPVETIPTNEMQIDVLQKHGVCSRCVKIMEKE
jgi:hypothetical protein